MPYRHAHFYVLALIPASFVGFIGYFSALGDASLPIHIHSASSTLWILLLAAQSWSIHHGRRALHRTLGKSSLALFPFFFAGFFLVFQTEAQKVVDGNRYVTVFGPGIGVLTIVAVVGVGLLYAQALRHRRNVQLHARYMLAIPFLFLESVFGRILNNLVPGFLVLSLDDIRAIYWAIHACQLAGIALALALYARDRTHGTPFLIVCVLLALQSIGLEVFDSIGWWRDLFIVSAGVPFAATLSTGLVIGAAVLWGGWSRPTISVPRPALA